jgi:3D (Asp-Asp-Asp) domain-containing protein
MIESKMDRYVREALCFFLITSVLWTAVNVISNSVALNQQMVRSGFSLPLNFAFGATFPDFNFGAVGDWSCNSNTANTVNNIVNKSTEIVLGLGDYSYEDTADCWFDLVKPIESKMKIAIGNHDDTSTSLLNQYMNHFGLRTQYYSFKYQNVYYIAMSTELPYAKDSVQYSFVSNELARAASDPGTDWIVVYYHKLAYTSPSEHPASSRLRDTYHPLFDRYGVDIVFQAHNHNYQRSYPLKYNASSPSNPIIAETDENRYNDPDGQIYITVGTAGAGRYSLDGRASYIVTQTSFPRGFLNIEVLNGGTTFSGKFYANDGTIIDQFVITKATSTPPRSQEICGNGIDDDNDGQTDVADSNCQQTGYYYDPYLTFTGSNHKDTSSRSSLQLGSFSISALPKTSTSSLPQTSPSATECTTGWSITGYYRPVESDFNSGQTTTITPDGETTKTFDSEFLDSVRRNGAGKTNEGWYLKYWDGQYYVRELSTTWDETPTAVGDIATDQELIPTGTTGITVPTLPSPWNQQVYKASDIGSAITDKHIDVFTGEGSAARSETFRITSEENTLCMPPLSANDPPTAIFRDGKVLKTDENDPITITIRATDPEGDPSRFAIVDTPNSGTLSTITDYTTTSDTETGISTTSAQLIYTPKTGFIGEDSFEYRANDGKENGDIAVVSITVG